MTQRQLSLAAWGALLNFTAMVPMPVAIDAQAMKAAGVELIISGLYENSVKATPIQTIPPKKKAPMKPARACTHVRASSGKIAVPL